VTALPSNLAAVADDLARATLKDSRRTIKRRRIVTVAVAFALLALTASAAIATGWLSEKTPTAAAVPELAAGSGGAGVQVLLSGLGSQLRALSSEATPGGGICITLTGFEAQCVPTLLVKQQIAWFTRSLDDGTTVIFGIVREQVTGVDALLSDGRTQPAQIGNGAFYLELTEGPPTHVLLHMSDGTSVTKAVSPCPPATPDCAH
jgi:hypothetical protein